MNKVFYTLAWLAIVSSMLLIGLFIFWSIYPYKVTEFPDEPFSVESTTVQIGGYVIIKANICKYSDIQPTISRSFVDGIVYSVPEESGTIYEKGCQDISVYIYVPKALPPGTYSIHSTYRWRVNPIRVIEKQTTTEKFNVVKGGT